MRAKTCAVGVLVVVLVGCGGAAPSSSDEAVAAPRDGTARGVARPPRVGPPRLEPRRPDATAPVAASDAPPCTGCFVEVAAGAFHTCARTDDGRVACWGWNAAGQIGAESEHEEVLSPREASPLWVPGLAGAVALGLGYSTSCAALDTGRVACWGDGRDLGLGSPQGCPPDPTAACRILSPRLVPEVAGAVEVVAGHAHACARTTQGEVWCWGRNEHGETGLPVNWSSPLQAPARVPDVVAARLFARGAVTCALDANGGLTCWGESVVDCAPTMPTRLATGVVDVALGAGDLCIVSASGALRCRGANLGGELGEIHAPHSCGKNDAWTDEFVEVATGAARAVGVGESMCVWSLDGALRCFGHTLPPTSKSLVDIVQLPGAHSLAGGASHLVLVGDDGRVGALGGNWYGQLGDGGAYGNEVVMTPVWTEVGGP